MAIAAAALFGLALFFGSQALLARREGAASGRLAQIAGIGEAETGPGVNDRVLRPLASGLSAAAAKVLPDRIGAAIEARIVAAGDPVTQGSFVTILAGVPLVLGGLTAAATWRSAPALAPMVAALGVVGPLVWLSGRVTRRRQQINRELPDALDLIVVSVEAGLGLEAAIARITDQATGVLADEFRRVLAEMNLGLGRRRALQALAARVGVPAVSALVSAILQADQTGMGIAQVLRAQSDHLRTVRRQHAEEAAMKAPLKMLFPLVFFIFPALFVVVLGPAVLQLLRAMRVAQ